MNKPSEDDARDTILILDRMEGDSAVLIGEGKELILPKCVLPRSLKEGDVVHLRVVTDDGEKKRRIKQAKELLNEILGSKE